MSTVRLEIIMLVWICTGTINDGTCINKQFSKTRDCQRCGYKYSIDDEVVDGHCSKTCNKVEYGNKYSEEGLINTKYVTHFPTEVPNQNPTEATKGTEPLIILYWTRFYQHTDFEFGTTQKPFLDAKCPVSNCFATTDKNSISKADAVLFHLRNIESKTKYPQIRLPHQNYVFFLMEHPYNQWNNLAQFNSFFNITMTYRHDSDVILPYGRLKKRDESVSEPKCDVDNHINNKSKVVAWFVSNCNSKSGREKYVTELQKYISVDIYGKCGSLTCPDYQSYQPHMVEECYHMLDKTYKFYLSFESSICRDYVTEKLFNILKLHVVPIVFGGADYSSIIPEKYYINVKDFESPKDLADYLLYLDGNNEEYRKYFEWKSDYISQTSEAYTDSFCTLCEVLNQRVNSGVQSVYSDIEGWWAKEESCDLSAINQLVPNE